LSGAVFEDRTGCLGFHMNVHESKHSIVSVKLEGLQLTIREDLAVLDISFEGYACKCCGMAEHLGYYRDPVRSVKGNRRPDTF
jgi:hypothetical protein